MPQASPAPSDKLLDNQIEKKIHSDATLKKYSIDIDVDGGVATLSGKVPTEADRAKAATLANVKGIARVDNKIVVDARRDQSRREPSRRRPRRRRRQGGARRSAEERKARNGEKTKEGVSKTGEVITDG